MSKLIVVPTSKQERIILLDILRGIAVLGILFINMLGFSSPAYLLFGNLAHWPQYSDNLAHYAIDLFVTGKFYSIFSFLFGVGLAVQMSRVTAHGLNFISLYRRKMLILAVFGLLHLCLLWWGDILHIYAILGIVLLFFGSSAPRTLVMAAIVCLAVPVQLIALETIAASLGDSSAPTEIEHKYLAHYPADYSAQRQEFQRQEFQRLIDQSQRIYSCGSYREIFYQRWQEIKFQYQRSIFTIPHIFAMFLLGLAAGRVQFFTRVDEHIALVRSVARNGLIIGLSSSLIFVISEQQSDPFIPSLLSVLTALAYIVGATALSFGYLAVVILLARTESRKKFLVPFAAVGRMALSNYLFQSIVGTTICYSYGLALFGKLGPVNCLLLTIIIFVTQLVLSNWWLRYFQFGPLEWLWRTLTYCHIQPVRIERN